MGGTSSKPGDINEQQQSKITNLLKKLSSTKNIGELQSFTNELGNTLNSDAKPIVEEPSKPSDSKEPPSAADKAAADKAAADKAAGAGAGGGTRGRRRLKPKPRKKTIRVLKKKKKKSAKIR